MDGIGTILSYLPFVTWLARWIMMTFVVWLGRCSQFIPLDPLEQARNAWLALWEENIQFFGTFSGLKKVDNKMRHEFLACLQSNINCFFAERLIDLTFWRPRYDAQLPDDSSMFLIGLPNIYIYVYISMRISYWIPKTLHRKYREFNENNENWEATLRELLWRYPSEIVPSC